MFDLLISGGDVIDGRGGRRRRADVGIVGDRISAIGNLANGGGARAAETIDATGLAVTPGFIDVHTHFDAQVFWDPDLSPSPLHGVTTIIGGNCGFTIAPLGDDPAHGDYLMRMLARVEGIPLEALQQGVPWNWQTTAEYFDAIDGNVTVNAGFKVGHSALRRVVMGGDSVGRACTPDELETMKGLLRDGLEAGALGFSSSWSRTHNDPMGNMVPSRCARARRVGGAVLGAGRLRRHIGRVHPRAEDPSRTWASGAHVRHVGRSPQPPQLERDDRSTPARWR